LNTGGKSGEESRVAATTVTESEVSFIQDILYRWMIPNLNTYLIFMRLERYSVGVTNELCPQTQGETFRNKSTKRSEEFS
jgi:hypothetical protein